jgi:hypothetical protein
MLHSVGSPAEGAYFASNVNVGGKTAVEIDHNPTYPSQWYAGPGDRELDGSYITIHPGDHIVYKAWLWTDASTTGDSSVYSGAVMGLDIYGSNGRLCEISTPDGTTTYPTYPLAHLQNIVPWGSYRWVQVTVDFTVQWQYMADPWGAYGSGGTYATPIAFIPYIAGDSTHATSEYGRMYVAGTELYINP